MTTPLIFAVDIETTGGNLVQNAIVSIGYCIGTPEGKQVAKGRVDLTFEPEQMNPKTKAEFWDKQGDLLARLQKNAVPPAEGMAQFVALVHQWELPPYELFIVSDNPAFDIAFINYYLAKYTERPPIDYAVLADGTTSYRSVYSSDCYIRGACGLDYTTKYTSTKDALDQFRIDLPAGVGADHSPENDAEYIYESHWRIVQAAKHNTV